MGAKLRRMLMNADDKMIFFKDFIIEPMWFLKICFLAKPHMGGSYVDVSSEFENKDDLSMPCEHGVSRNLWRSEKLKMWEVVRSFIKVDVDQDFSEGIQNILLYRKLKSGTHSTKYLDFFNFQHVFNPRWRQTTPNWYLISKVLK